MGWSVITPLMFLAVGTTVLFGLAGGGWQVSLFLLSIFLPVWVVMTCLLWWTDVQEAVLSDAEVNEGSLDTGF